MAAVLDVLWKEKKTRLTLLAFGRGRLLAPKMLSIAFVQIEI